MGIGDGSARVGHAALDDVLNGPRVPTLDETLRDLFATERESAVAVLAERRDKNTAVKLTVLSGQREGRTFQQVFQTVACKKGCGHCCHGVQVHVTAAEALTIARGFRETLPEAHVAVVYDRVKEHADLVRGMTLDERYRARVPCPLLDSASSQCTVHDARPMRCRAHHSLDLQDCVAASAHPEEPRIINRYPDVMDAHEAMILGQKKALAASGLDAREFELSLALEVALFHKDAAERWARGERVFDAAAFTWPDLDPEVDPDVPELLLTEDADAEAGSDPAG